MIRVANLHIYLVAAVTSLLSFSFGESASAQLGDTRLKVEQRYGRGKQVDPVLGVDRAFEVSSKYVRQPAQTIVGQRLVPVAAPSAITFGFEDDATVYAVLDDLFSAVPSLAPRDIQIFLDEISTRGKRRPRRSKWFVDRRQTSTFPSVNKGVDRYSKHWSRTIGAHVTRTTTLLLSGNGRVLSRTDSSSRVPIVSSSPFRAGLGVRRVVLVNPTKSVYVVFDVWFDSERAPQGSVRRAIARTAPLHYRWLFEDTIAQMDDPVSPAAWRSSIGMKYEQAVGNFYSSDRLADLLQLRLTTALADAIDNPQVPLAEIDKAMERLVVDSLVKFLVQRLPTQESEVQQRRVHALGRMSNKDAIAPLIKLLERPKIPKKDIVRALTEITGQDFGEDARQWRKWWATNRVQG